MNLSKLGKIVLFGSGETSASGRKVFDFLFRSMSDDVRVAILETPAGFELNSEWVAGQVADFLTTRMKNYDPEIKVVPARKRGTHFSPDSPEIVQHFIDYGKQSAASNAQKEVKLRQYVLEEIDK